MKTITKRYKFMQSFKSEYGNHYWELGKWYRADGKLELCGNGFHCSKQKGEAFSYVQGNVLAEVECRGEHLEDGDKEVWEEMRVIRAWRWKKEDSVKLAIYAAQQVIDIFEKRFPNDDRPRKAIEAAYSWLDDPTKENRDAARDAAEDAEAAAGDATEGAEDAAWTARNAAWTAAGDAAWAARNAAWAARNAAWAARNAAWAARNAAWTARNAAWTARNAVWTAARDAWAARDAMMQRIYTFMNSLKLEEILITPNNIQELKDNEVFVFGSNDNGNHAGGAARLALDKFGAIEGQARGLQGQSYAVATLDKNMEKLDVEEIGKQIEELFDFARENDDKFFYLTKIGCGIAGFSEKEVKTALPEEVPCNVALPQEWVTL